MNFFKRIKLFFSPRVIQDEMLGKLTFIYISNFPERSYWEGEWLFPTTQTVITILLKGGESGPLPEFLEWYRGLPARYSKVIKTVEQKLADAYEELYSKKPPRDFVNQFTFAGASVLDPRAQDVEWDLSFDITVGDVYSVTVPFVGDKAGNAECLAE